MGIEKLTGRFWGAVDEGISGITLWAEANGHVVDHETLRSDTT